MALLMVIIEKEVEDTMKTMAKNKALSLDGFRAEFFQATWSIMKQDIVNTVEESRCNKIMHPTWNETFLALIPKVERVNEPNGFRPITLCNVIYRILATIMVKRIQLILPELIVKGQIGFLKGRQIADGFIVA